VVPSPVINNSCLSGAAVIASTDMWAVGDIGTGSGCNPFQLVGEGGGPFQTLAEHFDGTSWGVVPAPALNAALSGVAGAAGNMGEGQPVLRSRDPAGAEQEMWALFAVYQAVCKIIGIGVNAAGIPPARISFPHALAAATDTVAAFSP
jgi:hypothetical protein